MTVLTDHFADLADGPVNGFVEFWRPDVGPDTDGIGSTTSDRVVVPVVDGDLTSPDLDPGPARVMLRFGGWSPPRDIVIPDSDDPVQLTPLFTQFEVQPPAVVSQAWLAAAAAGVARDLAVAAGASVAASAAAAAASASAAAASAAEAVDVVAAGLPNATTSAKGGVKISGDLGGTWDAVTVPGLAAKAAAVHSHALADIVGLVAALDARQTTAARGVANGYAPLDASGLIPSTHLPSYVDDVLEYASLASLPASGATGQIYVALDTGRIYRWSGSAYVEISPSPGSTDAVPEGSTNRYYTDARAQAANASALAAKATDTAVVHLAGTETITGAKTFSVPPTVPAPSASGHAARKQDVDVKVGSDGSVVTLVKVTQAAYDALGAGRPSSTWYGIVG
ncbi:hypothetical protein [Nocardia bovistercoris]|uniref:Minor tail protein n=1 Tax=Nocardia bovistercoris TaxID=2785916 RepID=A0A931IEX3_9NOCA|nr:hypothetical protein [Nocardia bovistercoris]MBH0778832.1 hypothetical protein [Nocardia bovistercoris]